ncbi:peroxidase-like [Arctopsyche grandis]|uniref:peroxidase-like n=1 Tax=Arctopsyche grandis TaxID=121162 RepID=UPI00406D7EA8
MIVKIISYYFLIIIIINLQFFEVKSFQKLNFLDFHPFLKGFHQFFERSRHRIRTTTIPNTETTTQSNPFSMSFNNPISEDLDELHPIDEFKVFKIRRNEKFVPPCCKTKTYFCDSESRFRNLDGSCNNLIYPDWGVPNSTYGRLVPARYGNGKRSPRRSNREFKKSLPNVRKIRVAAFPTGQVNNTLWTNSAMLWGQFMAHDMSLLKEPDFEVECCSSDGRRKRRRSRFCYPIKISTKDSTMGRAGIRCLNFTRTFTDKDLGCSEKEAPAQQINAVTSWMDLSNVYGLSKEMSDSLRTFENGGLATEVRNGHIFAPKETNMQGNCPCNKDDNEACYKTGDSRSNQNPQLTIFQTIFAREHNRLALKLKEINPKWNDERLFQEARRILIAIYQHISYYEWLPIFLDGTNLLDHKVIFSTTDFVNDHDDQINPAVLNEHAHAAFRFFHTHIPGKINLFDNDRSQIGSISLSDWFNRPQVLESGKHMIEHLTRGMVTQNIEETDNIFVKEINDELFACGRQFGIDLRAADIQRDRDHALGYYNDYREYCNLTVAKNFDDYSDLIPSDKLDILKKLYKDYRDVDVSVGGALEELAPGAQVGPTFLCILTEQFSRTRKSDRFWFENSASGLNQNQLNEIRKGTVSRLFCDNGDGIDKIQMLGFTLISEFNNLKPCDEIPSVDLSAWEESN